MHNTNFTQGQVTVRRAREDDVAALRVLASLDSGSAPLGPTLIAESGTRILAAMPLGGGRPIADPFEPTAELLALLALRRTQLRAAGAPHRSLTARLRELVRVAAPQGRTS